MQKKKKILLRAGGDGRRGHSGGLHPPWKPLDVGPGAAPRLHGGPALDDPGHGRGGQSGAPVEGAGAEDGAAAAQQLRVRVTARHAPAPPRRRAPDTAPRLPRGGERGGGQLHRLKAPPLPNLALSTITRVSLAISPPGGRSWPQRPYVRWRRGQCTPTAIHLGHLSYVLSSSFPSRP